MEFGVGARFSFETDSKLVSSWFRVRFELVSSWFRVGFELVSSWFRVRFELGLSWFRVGFELVSSWFRVGFELVRVGFQPGRNLRCLLSLTVLHFYIFKFVLQFQFCSAVSILFCSFNSVLQF